MENYKLTELNVSTKLREHLNLGIVSLNSTDKSYFRPHICLNGREGVEVIYKITSRGATANTAFSISARPIISGNDFWLNAKLNVYIDEICWPTNMARLSPRQSAYIIQHLPEDLRSDVLEKIKIWYFENFMPKVQEGLSKIARQFNEGDPLLESDHNNWILDIHGGRVSDSLPYTEGEIVGQELFNSVYYGGTFMDREEDGYVRADLLIESDHRLKRRAANSYLDVMSQLRPKR